MPPEISHASDFPDQARPQEYALQWYAVRTRPLANPNQTTQIVGGDFEVYIDRRGRRRTRRIKGTGERQFVIEMLLQAQRFDVFLPTKKVWRRKSRYTKEKRLVSYPLLVGWLFIGWPISQNRWGDLFRTNLVYDVAATDGVPFMIPNALMDDMFERWGGPKTQAPRRERFMRTHYEFNVGDRARVVEGPFDGQIVRVVDLRGAKAKVLLAFLGVEREINIDTQILEVA